MKIISVSTQKGGAGKTTITALLANSLSKDYQKKVMVIDVDEQGTLSDIRSEDEDYVDEFPYEMKKIPLAHAEEFLDGMDDTYDLVLIDMPGRTDDDKIIALISLLDAILIPIVADKVDLYSTLNYVEIIKKIEDYNREEGVDFKVYAMQNKKRGRREERDILDYCEKAGVKIFDSSLRNMAIYSRFNTYESFISEGGYDANPIRDELKALTEEFIEKFNL